MKDKIYRAVSASEFKPKEGEVYFVVEKYNTNCSAYYRKGRWRQCFTDREIEPTHVLKAVSLPGEEEMKKEVLGFIEQYGNDDMAQEKANSFGVGFSKCYNWLCNIINGK